MPTFFTNSKQATLAMATPTPRSVAARPVDASHAALGTIVFRGIISATPEETPAHCSAPHLQASFRLPRLSRDIETITRPRAPLRPTEREEESDTGAEAEFNMGVADEAKVKVEADEPIVVAEDPRQLCARLSAVWIAPRHPAASQPRGPGRPKGSKSRPRVEQRFDTSAPPERDEAKKARAKWTPKK